MSAVKQAKETGEDGPIFANFFPKSKLYDEKTRPRLFQSETSASWFLRVHREKLVKANAIAVHAGRILVDPDRCAKVAEEVALENARAHTK